MAELAIPLVALGGLYVISNHDKKDEGFANMGAPTNSLPNVVPPTPPINYPVTKGVSDSNPRRYPNANQTTDKFFNQQVFERVEQNNPRDSVGGTTQTSMSLTGEPINKADFKHNNMVPFFGARVKGATVGADIAQTQLDNMQGAGSQYRRKTEQAPLFKPQANMTWANGMPNTTEFMLSRQNPSTNMNNIKPWDEVKVAPGLGLGYTASGSGSGYNAAVEDRNAWLPKTVDQLRTDTNPKMSFGLDGHQGPAAYYNKEAANTNTMGKVEKNRPDTNYEVGPSRWFTTTGLEKGPTVRSDQVLAHTNRPDYSETDYYGAGAKEGQATYINSHLNNSHKQQLDGPGVAAPTGKAAPTNNDYGNGSYKALCNNRSTTRQPQEMGALQGLVSAMVAPVLDALRPTRKENVIGNARVNGNAQSTVNALPVYNPGDRTRTTIREQTEQGNQHLYVQGQTGGAYKVSKQQSVTQERDSTCVQYSGNAAPLNSATMSQVAAYNQRNNPNKTALGRTNQGGMQTLNSNVNMALRDDTMRQNTRQNAVSANVSAIPSLDTYGDVNMPQYYNNCQGCDRINPDILTAFKNNPYTQSLNSYA